MVPGKGVSFEILLAIRSRASVQVASKDRGFAPDLGRLGKAGQGWARLGGHNIGRRLGLSSQPFIISGGGSI